MLVNDNQKYYKILLYLAKTPVQKCYSVSKTLEEENFVEALK
jgi:hypothetical protein